MNRTPLQTRVGIDLDFGCSIGAKQIALLEAIQSQGSISGAARFLDLSYRGVQLLVGKIDKSVGEPVIKARPGGLKGGGAVLTLTGEQLVRLYRASEARAQTVALQEREELSRLARPKIPPRTAPGFGD
jgi:molybdate transport system regulatory protein